MRVMTAGAMAMAAALAAGAVTAAPKTLQCTMTTVTDAPGMHLNIEAKIWVKGQKARAETSGPPTGQMLVLVDGPKIHYLDPQQKRGRVMTMKPGQNGPRNPWEVMIASVSQLTHGAKKLGQQKLDGYPCDVYELTQSSPTQSMTVKSWVTRTTQPRLPLKVESTSRMKRSNGAVNLTQTTRLTALRIGVPLPDSLFAVPPGYTIAQASGPGLPGGPGVPGMGPGGPRQ
jgi:hypothetical protein